MRVLVVDDELRITRLVRDYFTQAGFDVVEAGDGDQALAQFRRHRPDLVVLDLGLPGIDGLDVTRQLRADSSVPIIMLTARSDETDRIVGLELGADDYIVKPFSPRELVARARAVLRRVGHQHEPGRVLHVHDLTIDGAKRRVLRGAEEVELTPSEFDLLSTMASQPGRVFTRGQLLVSLHGTALDSFERAIDAHVKNIRRKLEADPRTPRYIQTVHGVGYRLADA